MAPGEGFHVVAGKEFPGGLLLVRPLETGEHLLDLGGAVKHRTSIPEMPHLRSPLPDTLSDQSSRQFGFPSQMNSLSNWRS